MVSSLLKTNRIKHRISSTRNLWVLYFCYSAIIALIFQKLLLPLVPSLHGGAGLLSSDAHLFHLTAISFANEIKLHGWNHWTPWIAEAYSGNVAILAALYVYFEPDPSLLIPINAALHATGGILIFLIGRIIWPGRIGFYAGLAASILFILFPSALNWYAQVHKDGYSISGLLLIIYSWLNWSQKQPTIKTTLYFFLGNIVGCLFIAFVRPYLVQLLIPITFIMLLLLIFYWSLYLKTKKTNLLYQTAIGIISILLITTTAVTLKGARSLSKTMTHFENNIFYKQLDDKKWRFGEGNIENYKPEIEISKESTGLEKITLILSPLGEGQYYKGYAKKFSAQPNTHYTFSVTVDSNLSTDKDVILITDGTNKDVINPNEGNNIVSTPIKQGIHHYELDMKTSANARHIIIKLLAGSSLGNREKSLHVIFSDIKLPIVKNKKDSLEPITPEKWKWSNTSWMPDRLENLFRGASTIRVSFIQNSKGAGSVIDKDKRPANIIEMLTYLPRSLQIALFAPFPDTWFNKPSLTRLVGVAETLIWYLIMPGIFLALYYRPSISMLLTLTFALSYLIINAYVNTNLGTLHRVRYPFIFLLITIGLIGWVRLIYPRYKAKYNNKTAISPEAPKQVNTDLNRKQITQASALVTLFTGITFLLLFFRDILMSRWFGLGAQLDAFYIAMAIPMFFVNVLSVPLGAAIIPIYQKIRNAQGPLPAQQFISYLSFISLILLGSLSLLLLLSSPWLLSIFGWGFNGEQLALAQNISPYSILLLFVSGSVVLGNTILNANNRFFIPAIAQAIVPISAILCLLFFSNIIGIISVAVGMIIGQLANLLLIYHYNKKLGISLLPKRTSKQLETLKSMVPLFSALAISALFLNATSVIDNVMASTIGEGSVSAYSLGIKAVTFVTGVIGAGVTSVLLPYFSSYIAQNKLDAGRNELSFYLLLGSILTIPIGLIFFKFAYILINFIYQGGNISIPDAEIISNVAAFGMIQLPFFTVNILLVRFANARQHSSLVLISALLGLILNITLNFLLIEPLGTAGLALSTTLSLFISSVILLILMYIRGDLPVKGFSTLIMLWLLYLTSILSLHFDSTAGVFVSVISAVILLMLKRDDQKSRLQRGQDIA